MTEREVYANVAIEILEERAMYLRSLIRKCRENSDRDMINIPTDDYEQQLEDVKHAIEILDDHYRIKQAQERFS
jgi:hypothetical protein